MVGIDFFDADAINTLIPIFSMHPNKEYLVADHNDEKKVNFIINAIKKREGSDIEVIPVFVDADNFDDIHNQLDRILKHETDNETYIDLTGGSELMNACGYKLGIQYDTTLLHINFKQMTILDIRKGKIVGAAAHITLEDYLEAIGAQRVLSSHYIPSNEEFEDLKEIARYIFAHERAWKSLNKKFCDHTKKNKMAKCNYSNEEMIILNRFRKKGLLIEKDGEYQFRDAKAKEYLTVYGIWLELYIYINVKQVYGDAELGLRIDWDKSDNLDNPDNEIDVVMMYKSIPVFISCKMKKPEALDISEVGYLAHKLGGKRGRAVMATTHSIRNVHNETFKGIYYRMQQMNVGCIETGDFVHRTSEEVLDELLKSLDL